jgi:hypothetical protein
VHGAETPVVPVPTSRHQLPGLLSPKEHPSYPKRGASTRTGRCTMVVLSHVLSLLPALQARDTCRSVPAASLRQLLGAPCVLGGDNRTQNKTMAPSSLTRNKVSPSTGRPSRRCPHGRRIHGAHRYYSRHKCLEARTARGEGVSAGTLTATLTVSAPYIDFPGGR